MHCRQNTLITLKGNAKLLTQSRWIILYGTHLKRVLSPAGQRIALFFEYSGANFDSMAAKKQTFQSATKNGISINAKTGLTQTLTHTGKSPGSTAQYKAAIW